MKNTLINDNFFDCVGMYFGEPGLVDLLKKFDVDTNKPPKIHRGEQSLNVVCAKHGIELVFRKKEALHVFFREYPEGAIVLAGIIFHGYEDDDHRAYKSSLPMKLSFNMTAKEVSAILGKAAVIELSQEEIRWDFPQHCLFAEFGGSRLIGVTLQMPNKYTLKK